MKWTILLIAIGLEVSGTVLLKISNGGQKLGLILTPLMLYCSSLWFLSIVLKYMRMNVAYAIWSGLGLILLTFIQSLFFKEQLTFSKIIFSALIIAGIVGLNFTSKH